MENQPKYPGLEEKNNQPLGPEKKSTSPVTGYLLFELGIEFAVMLALPLLAFIYGGKWLDNHFHTKFLVPISILLALALSSYMIYKKINELRKLIK